MATRSGSLELERFHPVVRVRRTIDPALLALNGRGALNGHIPITAIVMSVAVVVAALVGADEVVMANERDASLPTRVVDGEPVNHQYSKSWDFERRFDAAVRAEVGGIDVYSLLRPVPEALIFGRIATMTDLLPRLSSCNRVRTRGGGQRQRGGAGATRARSAPYSFLGLAAHLPPDVLVPIFGRNLLDDGALLDEFARPAPARRRRCGRSSASANPTTPARCLRRCCAQPAWSDDGRVPAVRRPRRCRGARRASVARTTCPHDVWPALLALDDQR